MFRLFKKKPSPSDRRLAYLLLLINTITWGAALIFVKPALDTTTPFRFLLYRYSAAIFLSLPILLYYLRQHRFRWKQLLTMSVLELVGTTLSLTLLYMGLARTSAVEASMITTTSPIFIVIGGVLFLKEKQQLHETIGMILAFGAAAALVLLPVMEGQSILHLSLVGNLLVLAQNVTSSAYYLLAKKHYRGVPKLLVSTLSFYIGGLSFLALSLAQSNFSVLHLAGSIATDLSSVDVWFASLYMAIFGSIIGLTAYIKGQELIEASEASVFWYLQPLIYVPLGILLLREKVSPLQVLLLGVILFGVIVAEKRFSIRKFFKHA